MNKNARLVCMLLPLLFTGCAASIQPMLDFDDPAPSWSLSGEWTCKGAEEHTPLDRVSQIRQQFVVEPTLKRLGGKITVNVELFRMNKGLYTLKFVQDDDSHIGEKPEHSLRIAKVGDRHVAQIRRIFRGSVDPVTTLGMLAPIYAYAFVDKVGDDTLEFTTFDFAKSVETVKASEFVFEFSTASPTELKEFVCDPNIRLHSQKYVFRRTGL